ncbi:type II toxin-antitoxin system VapB family antitoxin [Mycolicibacter longobardus]|uniref:type II toxin-antitoxin system VapB family antitoxin n=1 Tax=Mycolicibacter longobardus TaxID=1108812 RepID=UPI0021F3A609|nr:type II toxin-antitoxin system VapB family antitoxin [Mycolicibacter longobardus]MCV7386083.1 type II toxin-antitoxin system VapB family antitoxin [Mycolicibacter longobardus]
MAVRRTTIELDEDLVRAAQSATGQTLRSTVEEALRRLVADAERQTSARRRRIADHIAQAEAQIDVEVLLADQAWR